jgi:putative endonuclease
MRSRSLFVYILASRFKTLYIGVTNDLERRLAEHRMRTPGSFTARYRIDRLAHFEVYGSPKEAIMREKQLKGWRRERKVDLIESMNPGWEDLGGHDSNR